MAEMRQLYTVLQSLTSLFDRLLIVENNKLDAIAVNDIDKLEENMRAEQAFTMELRGLDIKREKVQEELGYPGFTMQQIIAEVTGEDKEKLTAVFQSLQEKTEDLSVAVACTKKFIELHLHSLDFLLAQMGDQKESGESPVYKASGTAEESDGEDAPRFTPRKV